MIYLEVIQNYLKKMGINTTGESTPRHLAYALIKCIGNFVIVGPFLAFLSLAFIYSHRNELNIISLAIAQILGCVGTTTEIIYFKANEREIMELIRKFQETINNGVCYLLWLLFFFLFV